MSNCTFYEFQNIDTGKGLFDDVLDCCFRGYDVYCWNSLEVWFIFVVLLCLWLVLIVGGLYVEP